MPQVAVRERDLDLLRRTFSRFPCVQEVRVFGSRASGRPGRASDIDLAVSAPGATVAEWAAVTEALEEAPLILECDLVRLDRVGNARLRERIAREGVIIYPEGAAA